MSQHLTFSCISSLHSVVQAECSVVSDSDTGFVGEMSTSKDGSILVIKMTYQKNQVEHLLVSDKYLSFASFLIIKVVSLDVSLYHFVISQWLNIQDL